MISNHPPRYRVLDPHKHGGMKYELLEAFSYYSERYKKWVHCSSGMMSDGATGAKDLPESMSWWVHDRLCDDTRFADGSDCSAWKASMVLRDILDEEGNEFRKYTWQWMTFLCGSWRIKRRVGWR